MRFMMIVIPTGYDTAKPGAEPDVAMVEAMTKYNESLHEAGVLLAMDGLHPPSEGARVTFKGGKPTVKDGPFAEAKEVVGGYWMIDVKSKAEAVEWARRVPGDTKTTIEVRQVQEIEEFSPEIQAAAKGERALQDALQKKRKKA